MGGGMPLNIFTILRPRDDWDRAIQRLEEIEQLIKRKFDED